jgi:tetratricopeptide (TPR) repeat protein
MKRQKKIYIFTCILFFCLNSGYAAAVQPAYLSNFTNGFGPFDYTDPSTWKHIDVVEKYHFDEGVKNFSRGLNGSVWSDISYVLRAFPNHHPALEKMAALLRMQNTHMSSERRNALYYKMPKEVKAEAYFDKAIRMYPHDATTFLLYGIHLHRLKKYKEALKQYKEAEKLGMPSADLYYNMGLLYIELDSNEKAYASAKKAYGLGHPLPGLRNKLIKLGAWKK